MVATTEEAKNAAVLQESRMEAVLLSQVALVSV